ncbi:hypothetical protein DL96DRAFT_1625292, partial [Flagelloscypha sp. PMI_526]
MRTPKAGRAQHPELEVLPQRARSFQYTTQWAIDTFWTMCLWFGVLLIIMAMVIAYTLTAVAFGRHILSHYHLWGNVVPSDADWNGYLTAGLVASVFAGILISLLFRTWVGLVNGEIKDDFLFGVLRFVSKRFLSWCLFAAAIIFSWVSVVISGVIMHPTFSYVTPLSMLGIYAFGNLLAAPSVVVLVLFFICI